MRKLILLSILTFVFFSMSFAQNYGWTNISANLPDDAFLSDVFFTDDNTGWISSSSNANIYRTDDGAETFSTQVTSLGTSTEAIYMIDADTGFCGGASGFVYNTPDGGNNWNFLGAMSTTLTDMDFVSANQGYACGGNGAVYSITSTGISNLNSGQPTYFAGISSSSVNNVWVCGGNGIMYYNGTIFDFQAGPAGTYNSIFFISDQEGWVVGNSGIIGHTVNGGITWSQQTNPSSNSLYDVFFLNTEVGWAVGSQGTILYTSNGGDTWTVQGAGLTTSFLRGVHFTSPTNGYVVGNDKTLLKYGEILGIGSSIVETLQFEIFPNPASNKFEIIISEFFTNNCKIELHDLYGKILIKKQIATGHQKAEIDVSNLASGVYFCTMKTDKKRSTKKLIIE